MTLVSEQLAAVRRRRRYLQLNCYRVIREMDAGPAYDEFVELGKEEMRLEQLPYLG